jgi:hypothetical protein
MDQMSEEGFLHGGCLTKGRKCGERCGEGKTQLQYGGERPAAESRFQQ